MPLPERGKVYICNDTNQYDFSEAEKFGSLVAVTTGSVNVFNIPVLSREVQQKLEPFDTRTDFLLLTGHGVLQWACIQSILSRPGIDQVNTLVFGAMRRDYEVVRVRDFFRPASEQTCPQCGALFGTKQGPRTRRGRYANQSTTASWDEE